MNPIDLIFATVSDLTGGLITDITTLIIGLVSLGFILFGLDKLVGVLSYDSDSHSTLEFTGGIDDWDGEDRSSFYRDEALRDAKAAGVSESQFNKDVARDRYNSSRKKYSSL